MIQEPVFDIILWKTLHKDLLKIVAPIIMVAAAVYFIAVMNIFWFIIFSPILYLFIAGVSRECFWYCDFTMMQITSYDAVKKYFWYNIKKPPSKTTWLRMYVFWLLMFRPTFECRMRRLSRRSHGN